MAEKKKPGFFKRISKRLKDVISEAKKVTWPTWSQTWKSTLTVLVMVAIFAVVVCGLDLLFAWLRSLILALSLIHI